MPGFIENVQGRELLFKILEGVIETANPLRTGSTENALPGYNRLPWRLFVLSCYSLERLDGLRLPRESAERRSCQP